jgi:hypothetical protein
MARLAASHAMGCILVQSDCQGLMYERTVQVSWSQLSPYVVWRPFEGSPPIRLSAGSTLFFVINRAYRLIHRAIRPTAGCDRMVPTRAKPSAASDAAIASPRLGTTSPDARGLRLQLREPAQRLIRRADGRRSRPSLTVSGCDRDQWLPPLCQDDPK